MTTICMDESGFTGDDLLQDDHPHLVIASTLIGDEEDTMTEWLAPFLDRPSAH